MLVQITDDGTGSPKKGNYYWKVTINDTVLASGVAKGHQRAKGWKKLLKKVTNAAMKVPTFKVEEMEQPELPVFTPDHASA